MSDYKYDDLEILYENFRVPALDMEVGGTDVVKKGFSIVGAQINISAGFEAGLATIKIGDAYDKTKNSFIIDKVTSLFVLGQTVELFAGYGAIQRSVFVGFISQIGFNYEEDSEPVVIITAMDIKGVMMNGQYNRQLKANAYSDAVKEIFEKTASKTLLDSIYKLVLTDTPDHKEGGTDDDASAFSVEMVNETDYEFIVRAAKRYNYEFFCVGKYVYFRKAKSEKSILMEVGPDFKIIDFNVDYNISGLSRNIEVRGVDVSKGVVILGKKKVDYKISTGSKWKPLIGDSEYVLQDPTINSDEDANYRIEYLEDEISNRFARLSMETIGIPELIPGRFIELYGLSAMLSKQFYITSVTHTFMADSGFTTRIEGTAPTIENWATPSVGL